jgi:hypothetical protein
VQTVPAPARAVGPVPATVGFAAVIDFPAEFSNRLYHLPLAFTSEFLDMSLAA